MKKRIFSILLSLALVLTLGLVTAVPVAAATLTVDTSLADTPPNYHTIQAAIDAAGTDDTIIVADATYAEQLVVGVAGLTIQAAGSAAVIDGGGMLGPGVRITAANVTFQGFTVTDFTCNPYAPPEFPSGAGMGAIWATGDGVVIDGNTIYDIRSTAAPPFVLTNPNMWPAGIGIDVAANNVEVTNNTVYDVDSIGIRVRSDYEEAWPGDTLMSGILVEGNTVYNTANSGVLVAGVVTDVTIKNNEIYNSLAPTPYGLLVVAGASTVGVPNNVLIEGNTIYGSYGNVCLGSVYDINVTGNTIYGAIPHYSDPNIKGKNIYIRDWTAVQTSNVTITNNDITGANGYGVNIKGNVDISTITINFNNISGNSDYGVLNEITTDVDALYNWWGDISGPEQATTNPGGTGDEVGDNVDYQPWLTRVFQTVLDDNIRYFGEALVRLDAGWNMFSTPIALDPACDTWGEYVALGDGLNYDTLSTIYAFDGTTQSWVQVTSSYQLNPCEAIYVRMAQADIAAILYSPNLSIPSKQLYSGWNLVGLASLTDMSVLGALTSVYTVSGGLDGYAQVVSPPMGNQEPWIFVRDAGSPPNTQVTKGYWVFMTNNGMLAGFTFTPMSLP